MRLRDLPVTARLAADPATVFGHFAAIFDLAGAAVVEIGGRLPTPWVEAEGVRAWWAVDPRNTPAGEGVVRAYDAVASAIPLPDASADLIFSCNAFQHIHGLGPSLEEMARVLRPGGYLYANFGPVWSAPDGSHVEDLEWRGERLQFWQGALLPSWAHLVFSERELVEVLTPVHGGALAGCLARYVHHSSWINRLFFDDYRRLVAASPLDIVQWQGNGTFDYPYDPPPAPLPWRERLHPERVAEAVRQRHGDHLRELQARDVECVLRRRPE